MIVQLNKIKLLDKMGIQGERWVVKHKLVATPTPDDFELVKEDLGDLEEGEIAYETEFVSVDPWQVKLTYYNCSTPIVRGYYCKHAKCFFGNMCEHSLSVRSVYLQCLKYFSCRNAYGVCSIIGICIQYFPGNETASDLHRVLFLNKMP